MSTVLVWTISVCAQTEKVHVGMVQDWSHKHMVVTAGGTPASHVQVGNNPRLLQNWVMRWHAHQFASPLDQNIPSSSLSFIRAKSRPHSDWAISMGGTLSIDQSPAKYSFDIFAPPDCVNDFVVFGINVNSSATQANLIGFNQLYTGTPAGLCAGTQASTYFAYNTGIKITQSVVLSDDGKSIAFVDNNTPNSTFHVLAWAANSGTITAPTTPTVVATPPGPDQMTSLTLTGRDTGSAPFYDDINDFAYVGTTTGRLYRIKDVFCTLPACVSTPVAPSIDASFGAGGFVTAGTRILTSPVYDFASNNIFVGSSDGKLYGFSVSTGTPITGSPLTVGNGLGGTGGIITPPIVDGNDGVVYVATGDNGANAVIVQTQTGNFTSARTASLGLRRVHSIHLPALNDNYFSQATNTPGNPWFIYSCGYDTSSNPFLYRVGFDASRNMDTAIDAVTLALGTTGDECTAMTEWASGGVDRLYFSMKQQGQVEYADITTIPFLPAAPGINNPTVERGGVSGIIIDNISTDAQASNIYFSNINRHQAVKLNQVTLQ
jgi:hypothetical protein